jgi:hypothetical protein
MLAAGSRPARPVRGNRLVSHRLEAVLAEGREVDREIDAADDRLGELVLPVEHGREATGATGRMFASASDLAARARGLA